MNDELLLDVSGIIDEETFHEYVSQKLDFPGDYGHNLNPFWHFSSDEVQSSMPRKLIVEGLAALNTFFLSYTMVSLSARKTARTSTLTVKSCYGKIIPQAKALNWSMNSHQAPCTSANNRRHGDVFSIAASPTLQSRACCGRYTSRKLCT
ncbi:barstar family protein [Litchfieldella anticariensis]|uniref:barstar family protein n=1 Tax=Litchfieldella anticariensis TaxID=258591 RepID=UPI00191C2D10